MALIKTNPFVDVRSTPIAAFDADDLTKIIADNVHYVK